jgi:hypothetical protein
LFTVRSYHLTKNRQRKAIARGAEDMLILEEMLMLADRRIGKGSAMPSGK